MYNEILQWARDLNQYDAAIGATGILITLVLTGAGFVWKYFFSSKGANSTKIKNKKDVAAQRDIIQGKTVSVHNTHYHGNTGSENYAPNFSISKRIQYGGMYTQLEIRNTGNEPLEEIEVIRWDGTRVKNFLNVDEQQINAHPHFCETLDVDERKVIINVPTTISIIASAKGAKSGKYVKKELAFDFSEFGR